VNIFDLFPVVALRLRNFCVRFFAGFMDAFLVSASAPASRRGILPRDKVAQGKNILLVMLDLCRRRGNSQKQVFPLY
jgi:hypothetical protein